MYLIISMGTGLATRMEEYNLTGARVEDNFNDKTDVFRVTPVFGVQLLQGHTVERLRVERLGTASVAKLVPVWKKVPKA